VIVLEGPAGTWVLRDLQGRAVLQGKRSTEPSQIDLSALAAGTYLLTLDADGQRQTYRVVKR
jgi:hypothetical protein